MTSTTTRSPLNVRAREAAPAAPVRIAPDLLPAIVGPAHADGVLRPGHALHLCALPDGSGSVLISKDHVLTIVEDQREGDLSYLYTLRGTGPDVWETVAQCWPGVVPGTRFPRFCVIEEENEYASVPVYGLLDLLRMDVIARASREQVLDLCRAANEDSEGTLQRLAISEVTHALRTADPQMAGVVAEQVWAVWQQRLDRCDATDAGNRLGGGE